jgi:hypothetical protein
VHLSFLCLSAVFFYFSIFEQSHTFLRFPLLCVRIQNVFTNYVFNEAAFKHGIGEADIRMAFSHSLFDGLIEGYDNKFLLTGFNTHGNILEIMYKLCHDRRRSGCSG